MKPDIARFYTDEEIIQAAVEALRRKKAEIDGMIVGIDMARNLTIEAANKKTEMLQKSDLIRESLKTVEVAQTCTDDGERGSHEKAG
jgi:hypothetical protein